HRVKHNLGRHLLTAHHRRLIALFQGFTSQTRDSSRRSKLLQAAPVSAAAALLDLIIHMNMSHLSARSVRTRKNPSMYHDSAAHSGTKRNQQYIRMSLSSAEPHLSQRSYICIISCPAGKSRQL